jgi:hypothetical protein
MIDIPKLEASMFAELVHRVGGDRSAARLLNVSASAIADWRRGEMPPSWTLRLLWCAGPDGRAAAHLDLENELRIVYGQCNALRDELARTSALVNERISSLGAQVVRLQSENEELRRMIDAEGLADDLFHVRQRLDEMIRALKPPPRTPSLSLA